MADELGSLIESLALWRTSDSGISDVSPRHRALAALRKRGPEVVPVLIERLEGLLAAGAGYRERAAAIKEVWDTWYAESDLLLDTYGWGDDIERHRTVPTASLPQRSAADERYRDPFDLKQGIIQALRQSGDRRAAPVLGAALGDQACVPEAARALRVIRYDRAVPALLDAAARVKPDDAAFHDVLATLQDYRVSMAQARERFEAETSPQGRVSLMHLLTKLSDASDTSDASDSDESEGSDTGLPDESRIRDSLVFLALDDHDTTGRWAAVKALNRLDDPTGAGQFRATDLDAPPTAALIRSAITLAAHGNPPGHTRELTRRIRKLTPTRVGAQAVESLLTQDPPGSDAQELALALRLALSLRPFDLTDPMRLIRAAHRLSSDPQLAEPALLFLRNGNVLSQQMKTQTDPALREEARTVFESIARPEDRAAAARSTASRGGRWSKILGRLRR